MKLESVRIGKCQKQKVSEWESVRIGKCQNWKVSESESVRIGKCHNRKVSEFCYVSHAFLCKAALPRKKKRHNFQIL